MSRTPGADSTLDAFEFARHGRETSGAIALADMPRLRDMLASTDGPPLRWQLDGVVRERAGVPSELLLQLNVGGKVPLTCQRCLTTVEHPVAENVVFRLEREDAPLTQDELEEAEEVLPLAGPLDLAELVEDQVLLALPIVPMHEVCPRSAINTAAPKREGETDRVQPFADLRRLLDAAKPSGGKR